MLWSQRLSTFARSAPWPALALGLALLVETSAAQGEETAPPPVEAFARLPGLQSPSLSPDGRHVAMLEPVDGRYRPGVLALDDTGRPHQRVRLEPPDGIVDIIDVEWSGNARLLISALGARPYRSLPDTRLLIFDLEGQRLYPAVRPPSPGGHSLRARRASERRRLSVRLVDPLRFDADNALAMVTGPEADGTQLWRLNLESRGYKVILDRGARHLSLKVDARGVLRLAMTAPRGRPEILYRGSAEGEWREITPHLDPDAGDRVPGLTESGKALWVLRPGKGRGRLLYRFDPETMAVSEPVLGPTAHDVDRLIFEKTPGRHRLIGYREEADFRRDRYLDPVWAGRQRQLDARLPGSVNRIVSSSTTADRHIVVAERADQPAHYYLYDAGSEKLRHLGATYPALAGTTLPAKRSVTYTARDGAAIPAYLTRPQAGEPPFPAIVLVHGGPQSRTDAAFQYWPAFLASRGYLVLEPNFRGSAGYGEAWEAAGRGEWGGLMQRDVADGARWLREQGLAAARRLCIMGGSYGGYAALVGVAQTPELYSCAVAVNAVSDLERMVRDDRRAWPGAPWTRYIGKASAGEERLEAASPVTQAARIQAPVLLIHARDDLRVPFAHSAEMARKLEEADGDVNLVALEAGGHPLKTGRARMRLLEAVDSFLARHLLPRLDGSRSSRFDIIPLRQAEETPS